MVKHTTYFGNEIDYENPENMTFDLRDIAWALSNVCRFSGNVNRFYSVAEHSIHMHDYVKGLFEAMEEPHYDIISYFNSGLRYTLIHDASEAYMNDIPRNLKQLCPDYKAIEEKMMNVIYSKFMPDVDIKELEDKWKPVDIAMSYCENNQVKLRPEYTETFIDTKLQYWKPARAYTLFYPLLNKYFK
jgi:hypothetical protein